MDGYVLVFRQLGEAGDGHAIRGADPREDLDPVALHQLPDDDRRPVGTIVIADAPDVAARDGVVADGVERQRQAGGVGIRRPFGIGQGDGARHAAHQPRRRIVDDGRQLVGDVVLRRASGQEDLRGAEALAGKGLEGDGATRPVPLPARLFCPLSRKTVPVCLLFIGNHYLCVYDERGGGGLRRAGRHAVGIIRGLRRAERRAVGIVRGLRRSERRAV